MIPERGVHRPDELAPPYCDPPGGRDAKGDRLVQRPFGRHDSEDPAKL